jgi:hypothetical protein
MRSAGAGDLRCVMRQSRLMDHFGVPTNGLRRHIDASQQTGRSGQHSDVVVIGNHSPPLWVGPIGRAGGHTMRPTGRPRHAGAPFMQRACG